MLVNFVSERHTICFSCFWIYRESDCSSCCHIATSLSLVNDFFPSFCWQWKESVRRCHWHLRQIFVLWLFRGVSRDTRETIETVVTRDSKSTNERDPSLVDLLSLSYRFLFCLAGLVSPVQNIFFHHRWKSRLKCRLSLRRNEFHSRVGNSLSNCQQLHEAARNL